MRESSALKWKMNEFSCGGSSRLLLEKLILREEGLVSTSTTSVTRSYKKVARSKKKSLSCSITILPKEDNTSEEASSTIFGKHHSNVSSTAKTGYGRQSRHKLPTVTSSMTVNQLLNNALSGSQGGFRQILCDAADSFVTAFLSPLLSDLTSSPTSMNLDALLLGIYAPVPETPPTPCLVTNGQVPPDLIGGVYLRNGPNVAAIHQGDGFHVFDGDGMLHAVTLKGGSRSDELPQPIYCSRYVKTSRFRQEMESGRPLMPKFFGGMRGFAGVVRAAVTFLRWILGLFDLSDGWGLSNVSVCYFDGQILSLSEDDMPYVIKLSDDGDITTVGRFRLPSKQIMCAHPVIDPVTGDMYATSLNVPFFPPFFPAYSFFRLSADGCNSKSRDVPLPLSDVPVMHSFAMTQRFVVFPESQLVLRPWAAAKGEMPLVCDSRRKTRLCLLPRSDHDLPEEGTEAMWFEAPGLNFLHILNAWEEGDDEVVLVAPMLSPPEKILELDVCSVLSEVRLNRRSGTVRTKPICSVEGNEAVEFGVINPKYGGVKSRYAYLAYGSFERLKGVIKVDMERPQSSAIVAKREFGSSNNEGCYVGEPFFVPATEALSEDHGYLLCLVGDEKRDVSSLVIMDALSPSLEVMGSVELPSRVPFGFHGCFVTADQIARQKSLL